MREKEYKSLFHVKKNSSLSFHRSIPTIKLEDLAKKFKEFPLSDLKIRTLKFFQRAGDNPKNDYKASTKHVVRFLRVFPHRSAFFSASDWAD